MTSTKFPEFASFGGSLFVGRQRELDVLHRELLHRGGKTVCISGIAGIGKTSLAMAFAESHRDNYPAGIFNLRATTLESLEQSIERLVRNEARPFLMIVNDAEVLSQAQTSQGLTTVRRQWPNASVIVTSRIAIDRDTVDLDLRLGGMSPSDHRELILNRFAFAESPKIVNALYDQFNGHPLTTLLLGDLIEAGKLTPREALANLSPFTLPGLFRPEGGEIHQGAREHDAVVSDITSVSDDFLRQIRDDPELLYQVTPRKFEEVVAELLSRLGYEVTLTPASKDGGKDIYAARQDSLGTFLYVVECKKYAPDRPVGVGLIRQLHGVVQAEQATAGILATTSFFTKGAREFQAMLSFQLSLKDYVGIRSWLEEVLRG